MSICTCLLNPDDSNLELLGNSYLFFPFPFSLPLFRLLPLLLAPLCSKDQADPRIILNLLKLHLVSFPCIHLKFQAYIVNTLNILLLLSSIVHTL